MEGFSIKLEYVNIRIFLLKNACQYRNFVLVIKYQNMTRIKMIKFCPIEKKIIKTMHIFYFI